MDSAAGRIGRVAGDLCGVQCLDLPTVMWAPKDIETEMVRNRPDRGRACRGSACRSAESPASGCHGRRAMNPLARSAARLARRSQNIGDGMNIDVEIPAVDQLHLRGAFFGEVNVGVGESRDRRSTLEIDRSRCRGRPSGECRRIFRLQRCARRRTRVPLGSNYRAAKLRILPLNSIKSG